MVRPTPALDAHATTGRVASTTPTATASLNALMAELLTWLAKRHAETPPDVAARERLAVLRVLRECPDGLPGAADVAGWMALLAQARSAGSSAPRGLRRAVAHLRAFQHAPSARVAAGGVSGVRAARRQLEQELEGLPGSLQRAVREALDRGDADGQHELAAAALLAARGWREDQHARAERGEGVRL